MNKMYNGSQNSTGFNAQEREREREKEREREREREREGFYFVCRGVCFVFFSLSKEKGKKPSQLGIPSLQSFYC